MKILVRLFSLAVAAISILAACEQPEVQEPVQVILNKELISKLNVGETQRLEATVTPKTAQVTLVWASDNEAVASVDEEGNVTGVAPGTAEVSVTADDAVAKCKVVVTAPKPQELNLDAETLELTVGQTHRLEAIVAPDGAAADDMQWSSSEESVATVQDGTVTAVSEGKAVITVTCNGGKLIAECEVTVAKKSEDQDEKVLVSSITMSEEIELTVGASLLLEVSVLPENAHDKTVTFSVEGDCVSVDAKTGMVEALKEGNAVVIATANDDSGVEAKCNVTVTEPSGDTPSDDLLQTVVIVDADGKVMKDPDLQVGMELQLYLRYIPESAVPNTVSWTVDDPNLAQVNQTGLLKGEKAVKSDSDWSKVVVTVNADGVKSSLSVRVIHRQPDAIEVDIPEEGWIRVGQEWDFNPRVIPEGLGYGVTSSIMKPGNKFTSDSRITSDIPGTIAAQFAVASHENLVYSSYRKDVSLNVLPYWVESIAIPETQEMEVGGSLILAPVFTSDVEGVQPTYKDVRWSSSDQSVASINEKTGEIKAHTAGQTTITVTTANEWSVPGGQGQKSATCVLTVKAEDAQLNVGDYFYSDGTWSSDLQSGKTVVGIVFAKSNATAADPVLAKDFPGCTHGLVLGLTEYVGQDFGSVNYMNGHGYYADLGYDASSIVNVEKPNGYGNSKAHRDLNASKADYVALFNAESGVVATQTNAVATPSGASSWYVPSYKEMSMILANYDKINAAIVSAGGMVLATPNPIEDSWDDNRSSDWYWTSTIWGNWSGSGYEHFKYAFDLSKGGWTTSQQSFAKCKVRVVFAF